MEESLDEIRQLYKSVIPKKGEECVYCGAFATDKEHVTPISWIEKAKGMAEMGILIKVPEERIVPSCQECNLTALARIFETFREKKTFIRWRLSMKYKKWLRREEWTDEELDGLGGDMRRRTTIYNEVLKAMKRRLKKIGAESYIANNDYFKNLYEGKK